MMGKKIIAIENPTCGIEGVKYKKHKLAAAINMQIIQKKNTARTREENIPKRYLCIKFIIRV
ncbi:MAG TPA: hypothetical protein DIT52_06480 [Flavobacteriaceae bacterium]|nr:hypothetical protein [Flavobacteriaceae bacterium]|tara:strand:+ start:13943 stop:14128 length:186 start_codon:yes stop_codon:yes gene_type:complete